MQKNLGYVIPSIVIPDAATNIGYWYLGSVPLGVRATGTMWTIGADHYWYVDKTKTEYLAEIPVEEYNQQWQELIEDCTEQWDTYYNNKTAEINLWFNTEGAQFTQWFNRIKNQLSSDAAGHLQLEIDSLVQSFSEHIEDYDISSSNYAVGDILMYKNRLCKVVAAITAGDTFIADDSDPNQNIEYATVFELAQGTPGVFYNTDADAEADKANIPEGSMVYTNDGEDEPINARQIAYDDGTQAGSDVETQIKALYQLIEEMGGGGMPTLDYSNPLHTFSSNNLSYTATKDCYLVGDTITVGVQGTCQVAINGTVIGFGNGQSGYSTSTFIFTKLSAGDNVTLTGTGTTPTMHVFDTK